MFDSFPPARKLGLPDRYLDRIAHPELLVVETEAPPGQAYGCDQDWYQDAWQRRAGCGPCTAASILFYLSHRYLELRSLYAAATHMQEDFCQLMSEIWQYVTPGRMGVNEGRMLSDGVLKYASLHQLELQAHLNKIPGMHYPRAPADRMLRFIRQGLAYDCPVAFLNLSNGSLDNLENWHWVTIAGLYTAEDDEICALISDSGEMKTINLTKWYETTLLGGTFVYFTWKHDPVAHVPGQMITQIPDDDVQPDDLSAH